MRDDSSHLADMAIAAKMISIHIAGLDRAQFLENRTVQAAVEREISIIGEAANRVSAGFRQAHPELKLKRLIQLRNFYMHAYERLDASEVWATATRLIPQIAEALAALLPEDEDKESA